MKGDIIQIMLNLGIPLSRKHRWVLFKCSVRKGIIVARVFFQVLFKAMSVAFHQVRIAGRIRKLLKREAKSREES